MRARCVLAAASLAIGICASADEVIPSGATAPASAGAVDEPRPPRSAFTVGGRLGLVVPWGRPSGDVAFVRNAAVMPDVGLELGWRPSRDVWLGATASLAQCFTCESSGQSLIRVGGEVSFRALRVGIGALRDPEIWVGAGVAEAWLDIEPFREPKRRLRGVEVTLPRVELGAAHLRGRLAFGFALTVGRFTQDYSPGGTYPTTPPERLHGTVLLDVRGTLEPSRSSSREPSTPGMPPPPPGPGFLLAVGLAGGVPIAPPGSSVAAVVPVTVAAGYRFGPRLRTSAFIELESGVPRGCAPATACEPFLGLLGVQAELHVAPATYRDPWVGLAVGEEMLIVDRREGDVPVSESWDGPFVRAEAGFQLHRSASFAIGPFAALGAGLWTSHDVDVGGDMRSLAIGRRVHVTAVAGIRMAWLP